MEELLDRICQAADHQDRVSLEAVLKRVGTRSFGPLLLTVGIITVSPLTAIPGMPTSMAILVNNWVNNWVGPGPTQFLPIPP